MSLAAALSEHAITVRAPELRWLLSRLLSGESCCLLGVPNVGSTFVARTLSLPAVQELVPEKRVEAARPLIVFVDCNVLGEGLGGDSFFLLTAQRIAKARDYPGITSKLTLPAPSTPALEVPAHTGVEVFNRAVEGAVADGFTLCVIYDPFDKCLELIEPAVLLSLRAARDEYRPALNYVIATTQRPEVLRPERVVYPFTSLFWGRVRYLQPLDDARARSMLDYLSSNRNLTLPNAVQQQVIELSGGHPGLIRSLFEAAIESGSSTPDALVADMESYYSEGVGRECRSILESLSQEEIASLRMLLGSQTGPAKVEEELVRKGVVVRSHSGRLQVFSPLFEEYVRSELNQQSRLVVDLDRRVVRFGSKDITSELTATEHRLLLYLASRCGELCTKDDIATALWPDEISIPPDDNRIQKAVDRLRSKLASATGTSDQHIETIRGRGYRFVIIEGVYSG